MEVDFTLFVSTGLFLAFWFLLYQFYNNYRKKCAGFPFSHIIPYLFYCQVTGKISKDVPINTVFFKKAIEEGKKHSKEGLFMTFATRPILVIFCEEALKVFSNNKLTLNKSPDYKVGDEIMGAGLATSNGERWRLHRKLIDPAFNMGMLKEKVPHFNEHALALVKDMEKLAGKSTVDILTPLKYYYFTALCESLFGLKRIEENKAQILRIIECVNSLGPTFAQRLFCPWLRPRFLLQLSSFGRKHLRDLKEMNDMVTNFISEMKKHISSNERMDNEHFGTHWRKSVTYLLLNRHMNDPSFTFKDLHDEVKTLLATGYDSVTNTTMWCLFLLGLHPEIQEKVYDEIQTSTSDCISYEEASKLEYLECVIMETLRIYPTVPLYARDLSEDVQFGKYKVFKGTTIFFAPYLSHRDPKVFPDPEAFKPERFRSKEIRKSPNFIPFAEGSRPCLGKYYGLLKTKIFLAHILRNYEIKSLDRREDINLGYAIVISPAKPLRMKITLRHNVNL